MEHALRRCDRCRRHVRVDEARCPFCVLESRTRGFATAVTLGAALGACSARELSQPTQEDTSTTTPSPVDTGDTASSAATTLATTTSTTVMSETGPVDTSSGTTDDDGLGCAFYGGCPGDFSDPIECDVWTQDCPRGEKCTPYASSGGWWDATRCSPLEPNPAGAGEPCTAEGGAKSGVDNCEVGAMCWDVDDETNVGTCVDLCAGSNETPICPTPETSCAVFYQDVLAICFPTCDPLLQDCAEAYGCFLGEFEEFHCAPSLLDDAAEHGETCSYINSCVPGLHCANAKHVFDCVGKECCTEFCDLEAAEPDAACSGAMNGETCIALFDDGQHPNVGICQLPD
jgi:hypothetical protein